LELALLARDALKMLVAWSGVLVSTVGPFLPASYTKTRRPLRQRVKKAPMMRGERMV